MTSSPLICLLLVYTHEIRTQPGTDGHLGQNGSAFSCLWPYELTRGLIQGARGKEAFEDRMGERFPDFVS